MDEEHERQETSTATRCGWSSPSSCDARCVATISSRPQRRTRMEQALCTFCRAGALTLRGVLAGLWVVIELSSPIPKTPRGYYQADCLYVHSNESVSPCVRAIGFTLYEDSSSEATAGRGEPDTGISTFN